VSMEWCLEWTKPEGRYKRAPKPLYFATRRAAAAAARKGHTGKHRDQDALLSRGYSVVSGLEGGGTLWKLTCVYASPNSPVPLNPYATRGPSRRRLVR
jgi:hypothetical protein